MLYYKRRDGKVPLREGGSSGGGSGSGGLDIIIDEQFVSTSLNAQSGKAVKDGVGQLSDKLMAVLGRVLHYKARVENEKELEMISAPDSKIPLAIGDVYNVQSTGANYVWNGTEWDKLSESLSNLVPRGEFDTLSDNLLNHKLKEGDHWHLSTEEYEKFQKIEDFFSSETITNLVNEIIQEYIDDSRLITSGYYESNKETYRQQIYDAVLKNVTAQMSNNYLTNEVFEAYKSTITQDLTHFLKCAQAGKIEFYPKGTTPPAFDKRDPDTFYLIADELPIPEPEEQGKPKGTLTLTFDTTEADQVVDLGYCLGLKSENSEVTGGTINWGDWTAWTEFGNGDGIAHDKFKHTYRTPGNYTIIITGKIIWGSNQSTQPTNDVRKILTEVGMLGTVTSDATLEYTSAIYDLGIDTLDQGAFAFADCPLLESVQAGIFDNCTNITLFSYAFQNCPKLKEIPAQLFEKCVSAESFASTFSNCSKLTAIPQRLFENCPNISNFSFCFWSCTGITEAVPTLWDEYPNATGQDCFANCTSATNYDQIPEEWGGPSGGGVIELHITTTGTNQEVDLGYCLGTNSDNPNVIGGTIDWGDKSELTKFRNNESYTDDKFKHTYIDAGDYIISIKGKIPWVYGNSALSTNDIRKLLTKIIIPAGMKSPIYDVGTHAFYEAKNLTSIPAGLFDSCTQVVNFTHCFYKCTSLQSIPDHLFDSFIEATNFSKCFYNCASIQFIPEHLFANCTKVTAFKDCFYGCAALQSIPSNLFDHCTEVTDFDRCFYGDSAITSAVPELWNTHESAMSTVDCFRGCTQAINYSSIPSSWGGPAAT